MNLVSSVVMIEDECVEIVTDSGEMFMLIRCVEIGATSVRINIYDMRLPAKKKRRWAGLGRLVQQRT